VTFSWTLPGKPRTAKGAKASFVPSKRGPATLVLKISDSSGQSTTVSKAIRVVDTKKPKVALRKIASVRRGKDTRISGRATDASGIKRAKVSFGDGSERTVKLSRTGRFTTTHVYGRVRSYRVTFAARDKAGNLAVTRATARIRRR
jgi:hypothetical protein